MGLENPNPPVCLALTFPCEVEVMGEWTCCVQCRDEDAVNLTVMSCEACLLPEDFFFFFKYHFINPFTAMMPVEKDH